MVHRIFVGVFKIFSTPLREFFILAYDVKYVNFWFLEMTASESLTELRVITLTCVRV